MSRFEEEVERQLMTYAEQADTGMEVEERLIAGVRRLPARRTRRPQVTAAMGLGMAAAAAAIVGAATLGGAPSSTERPQTTEHDSDAYIAGAGLGNVDGFGFDKVGTPCPGARHAASVSKLQTSVEVLAPTAGTMTEAWTCGSTPVLMYTGIQISYEEGWGDVDLGQKWADMVSDYGGSVVDVNGHPAYVHPPTTDGPRSSVMFVVDGTLIRLLAEGDVPVDELVKLAGSIKSS